MNTTLSARMSELVADRVPFVHVTVVRAQVPASARPGDAAIVLADGSIEGFVGGVCAEGSVRSAAMTALGRGDAMLLRVLPEGGADFPEAPGAQVVVNPCLSGGALEIFLEPMLPPPTVEVVGTTPIGDVVLALAEVMGYRAVRVGPGAVPDRASAVVVATHGRDETASIRAALDAGVGLIALVASHRRGDAVLDAMGLTGAERTRVHTPAGLDLGARTAGEIALSILADVVRAVRRDGLTAPAAGAARSAQQQVIDPVCGMTVTVVAGAPHLSVDGVEVWFCGTHCRDTHAAQVGAATA